MMYDKNINPINIKIGDRIKIKKEPYDKFSYIYNGPFSVIDVNGQNISENLNGKTYSIHKNRVIKYD